MSIARRALLAGAAGAAPAVALARSGQVPERQARAWRRIATEEAFWTPKLAAMNRALAQSLWDQPDFGIVGWSTDPANETYKRLISFEGERLKTMDDDGVAMHVLSLTVPGVQLFEPTLGSSLARETNDVLHDVVARHPDRFAGLACLAPQDPQGAAKEMDRAINGLGLSGFIINSHTNNEYLDEPKSWPILEAAEALGAPIYLHPRAPARTMSEPYSRYGMTGAIWGFQAEAGVHAVRLILSEVFIRFPRLQVVLGHMGESIPYNLWRLDYMSAAGRARRADPASTAILPSEIFRRNFTITTSGVEHAPTLRYAMDVLGSDRIMFAIDWPFQPSGPAVTFMNGVDIPNADKAKIFHVNAERLFRLPPAPAAPAGHG